MRLLILRKSGKHQASEKFACEILSFMSSKTSVFTNPYLLLTITALVWGGNAVAGKLAAGHVSPFFLTLVRWLIACAVVFPFALPHLKKDKETIKKHFWFLFALGAIGFGLFNNLFYLALNYTTAINVAIEQASMPVFIILANFFMLSQRVTALQIVGVMISIVGVLVTASKGEILLVLQEGFNKGDAIMLLGCFFYATYTFVLRWRPQVHWLTFMCLIAVGALIMSVPFAFYEINHQGFKPPGNFAWMLLFYIVIVPSIISQLCFAKSVELIGGNRAGLFINLVPVFGSILAVVIIGEQFQVFHAVGMVLVIGGILLAERFALAENN